MEMVFAGMVTYALVTPGITLYCVVMKVPVGVSEVVVKVAIVVSPRGDSEVGIG